MQQLKSVDDYFPLFLDQTMQLYALRMKDNEEQADHVADRLSDRDILVDSVQVFQHLNIALIGTSQDECVAISNLHPYGSGVVTIREDTRGFIRSNFNQQFIIWPCQYDPQAILLFVLDQTSSYVQKQDRIDDTDPMLLAMFTKTLAIIDCISTLISIRPEYFDRFQNVILRIIYLLPGLWKMNVIPSHVLTGALTMMKHAQNLTAFFIDSNLFPSFLDKNIVVPNELDPTVRLPELDGALWARLELMCSENQYVDEWLPVFLTLIEVTRETIKSIDTMDRYRPIVFHVLFSTLPKSIKLKRWLPIRDQCLKLIWAIIVRGLPAHPAQVEDENNKSAAFIYGWLQYPSVSQALLQCAMPSENDSFASDPTNRTLYQSCLQNAMSIISSLIDYQVKRTKQNIQTTNNPFASKVLIKVCLDFLLQNITDVKASICLRCLNSLAKITPGLSILLENHNERFRTFILQNIQNRKSPELRLAILDFLIVCVRSQPALLGYMCDINTSPTATFANASILPAIVELLRWSTKSTDDAAAIELFILTVTFITQFWEERTQLLVDYFVKINDFWKNVSTPISNTSICIEMMEPGDKRAVAASFRLLTQHLLNYTTDQTGNDFYDILNKLITNNCLLHWIKACRIFFKKKLDKNGFNENSLSFSFFSSVIYFIKALLCLDNERIRKILPGGENWLRELASIIELVLDRNDSTCMKVAVICLNLTMNAFIKWQGDKAQAPLEILPIYINLSGRILAPEYVSIYVKYCYLDTLLLLIQTFLEWTPDIEQQQHDLTRYSTVLPHLLDFVDYCNEIIDMHLSTTPQYKCAVKSLIHTFHLLSIFVSKEESRTLPHSLQEERTVTNIVDLFYKVAQERDNFRVCYTIISFLYDLTRKSDSVQWFYTKNLIPRTVHTFRFIIQQQSNATNDDTNAQLHWSQVIRLYLLLNICLIHAERAHGDHRHFQNASTVFAACSEYIVESFHSVTRDFSLATLDNADVCCQFLACLTQFYTQLMSQYHKEATICIAAVNYLLHDAINLLLHSALVQNMLIKKVRCAYRSEVENQENIVPDYSLSQSTLLDQSQITQRSSLRPISTFLNQSITGSPATTLAPVTPGEGTPKPRLVNVRQQVAAASAQPASVQAPDFEQVQVGLLRLLCTCCLALRPCTIPLNELNESLLYKQTIDYDSFKFLVEPMFNTPTLERRTAPSFGTWLTGAQYIVTQMERFSLIKSNSPRPARIKESDLERLVQQRPFLVLALEYLLSLILSQVPLFMRSTLLSETQKNMMKQTLSLELDYIFSNLNLTERTSSASGGSDPNSQRTSVNIPTPGTVTNPASHRSLVMSTSNMSQPVGSAGREAYTPFSVGTNVTCSGATEYNNSTYLKDVCTSIWKLYKRIIQADPMAFIV